ncbi:MAG: proton-conducting transporter membrane subunit [Chloroflexi bacterium]|nr:proton-conducting transporter membrane subunit [Chloroflexota bacterium]
MLVIAPILIPFLTAIVCVLAWNNRLVQRWTAVLGSSAALIVAYNLLQTVSQNGIQILQASGWPGPFGIVLMADLLSSIMVLVTAVMGLLIAIYGLADIDPAQEKRGYHAIYQLLLMGVSGAFLTGDLFNLFVWFELMLITSFVLLVMQGERTQLEGAVKYVTMSLISSALFLSATGLVYGLVGALNMVDIGQRLAQLPAEHSGTVTAVSILYLIAFGLKAAIFPLYGWLPASYHTPPTAVTTLFGALLTKVGVYAILRTFTLIFPPQESIQTIILVLASLTMVTGVFGAVAQFDMRRLLAFHIISQIGYLVLGIGLGSELALAATIFYLPHVIFAKSALFLVSGIVNRLQGSYQLKQLGGLYKSSLGVSLMFFIPAMALAGIPPLSGFWAKFGLIRAGLEAEQYGYVAVALGVSVLTLYSMTKIWAYAFWSKRNVAYDKPLAAVPLAEKWLRYTPALVLGGFTLLMGIFAGPLFDLATRAAAQILNPSGYVTAVFGG